MAHPMQRCLLSRSKIPSGITIPRFYSTAATRRSRRSKQTVKHNYNANPFEPTPEDEDSRLFPALTAKDLAVYTQPARRYRTLTRDFIDDALYNPNYGYFTQQAVIFDLNKTSVSGEISKTGGLDFASLANSAAMDRELAKRYGVFEGEEGLQAVPGIGSGKARQVWHTPTELFQPWYARAVARYLVSEYKKDSTEDMIIYELGAGNGTLMKGILDYLSSSEPEIYARTEYKIIEISPRLAELQKARAGEHAAKVKVVQSDIFDWTATETRSCFFLAFEVLDNLAHDLIRFTRDAEEPKALQCNISVASTGEFNEQYTLVTDPLISSLLTLLPPLIPTYPAFVRKFLASLPFAPNLTQPIYLPTKLLSLLRILRNHFPNHRVLFSDFSSLPDAIPGQNAPVVQTRYKGQTVPCTTYLVSQGYFDIFFPTDFGMLKGLYERVVNGETGLGEREKAVIEKSAGRIEEGEVPEGEAEGRMRKTDTQLGKRKMDYLSHADFLRQWGETDQTKLKNGENPMLEYFENQCFAFSSSRD